MNTSYFSKSGHLPTAVSIAAKSPEGFTGRKYKQLAPKFWFFQKYKQDGDEGFYTQQYLAEVLKPLDPKKILQDLGEDAVLLCYELPGKFCHRRIVAKWLEENLGIEVKELK